jgi:molybdopterin/thiamine biosynthesis adenylyltransferase
MIDANKLLREFDDYYARNLAEATSLRACRVVIFGLGAVGGYVAHGIAHHGANITGVDRDYIERVNLARHYVSDPAYIGQPKAAAVAEKLRRELPALQDIRSIAGDIARLTRAQVGELFASASLVVAATGRDDLDRFLDGWARFTRIPILFPSLWAGQDAVLGDLQVVAWNRSRRRGACFQCLRPPRETPAPPAEAQAGLGVEVMRVASLTTEVALALLTDNPNRRAVTANLDRGVNYFLIPRWPPSLRPVLTTPRRGCAACASSARAATSASFSIRTRDWVAGGSLVTTILCHQFLPGFDYAATILFVTVAGFWWRGRLPSFERVADAVRRTFEGR